MKTATESTFQFRRVRCVICNERATDSPPAYQNWLCLKHSRQADAMRYQRNKNPKRRARGKETK